MSRALQIAAVLAALPLGAQQRPDFSGSWTLNPALSENVETKITEVAGPDDVTGRTGFGPQGHPGFGILPVPGLGKDVDRLSLRRTILDAANDLARIEITQTSTELKHIDSGDNVRIFYLTREQVRDAKTGEKVKCRSEWQGEKLVITQEGKSGRMREVYSLLAPRSQLVYAVRLEDDKLKRPLDLTLVYDRTPK